MNLHPENKSWLRQYWPYVKCVFFVIVLGFVVRRAIQLWMAAPAESIHINGIWLIPAGLAYFVGWLPSVWFWREMLLTMRQPLGWWDAIRAHYIGQLGKYVPGKAMVLVIRGSLAKEGGANSVLAAVTAVYETLVFMAAGAILSLALAPIAFGDPFWSKIPVQLSWVRNHPMLFGLFVFSANLATTPISSWLFTRIARKSLPKAESALDVLPAISAALISKGVISTSLGWACHALSLGFVMQSVSTHAFDITQFPIWLVACTLSTVGGFVVLIAPGGLGIREGLLIEVLKDQPFVGPTAAVVVAGLLRAVWFATELIASGYLYFAKRRK